MVRRLQTDVQKKVHAVWNFSKVKTLVARESPRTQESIVKFLNTYIVTKNKIMNQDLQLKKAEMYVG